MNPTDAYAEADRLFAESADAADAVRTPEEIADAAARAEEDFQIEAAEAFAEVYRLYVCG